MRATHRVIDSNHRTIGYMIDDNYITEQEAISNIDSIENLMLQDDVINVKGEELDSLHMQEINQRYLDHLCRENPLERDIQHQFEQWHKNFRNMILYVQGARQIGKTTELLKYAYANYENVIYINLSEERRKSFLEEHMTDHYMFVISKYCREYKLNNFENTDRTLLILDEIQQSSLIFNTLRRMQTELSCDIAITGSYLGRTLNKEFFQPAGNLYTINMNALSFREVCRAFGCEERLMHIDLYGGADREDIEQLTHIYHIYREIGGYPAVVNEYLQSESIDNCKSMIRRLIETFTNESASYFESDKALLVFHEVYKGAFLNMVSNRKGANKALVEDITSFVKDSIKENVSRSEVNDALAWLLYSKILGTCDLIQGGKISDLIPNRRIYFRDCGIANYVGELTQVTNEATAGIVTETFVYNEILPLYENGILKGNKPCFSVYNNYELDFICVDKADRVIGLEVKTSNSTDPKSLKMYMQRGFIDEAYLLGITRGGKREDGMKAIPIYTVGCRYPYDD